MSVCFVNMQATTQSHTHTERNHNLKNKIIKKLGEFQSYHIKTIKLKYVPFCGLVCKNKK